MPLNGSWRVVIALILAMSNLVVWLFRRCNLPVAEIVVSPASPTVTSVFSVAKN